jgi:hypothetical protein
MKYTFVITRVTHPTSPEPPFVLTRETRDLDMERERHFHRCDMAKCPFITVTKKRRYATVTLDMITCARPLTESQLSRVESLLKKFAPDDDDRQPADQWFSMSMRVPKEHAEPLARELFRAATEQELLSQKGPSR